MPEKASAIFLKTGVLTPQGLNAAIALKQRDGGSLSEAILRLGLLDEEHLVSAFQKNMQIPRVSAAALARVSKDVLNAIPADLAAQLRVIPMDIDAGGNLTLAMVDPSDDEAVEQVIMHTLSEVNRAVASPTAMREALRTHYGVVLSKPGAPTGAPAAVQPAAKSGPVAAPAQVAASVPAATPAPVKAAPAPVVAPVPAAKPAAAPAASSVPAAKPAVAQPAAQPVSGQPVKPAVQPAAAPAAAQPAAVKPVVVAQPAAVPAAKPVVQQPVAAAQPVPAAKQVAVAPAPTSAPAKPVAAAPSVAPTPIAAKPAAVAPAVAAKPAVAQPAVSPVKPSPSAVQPAAKPVAQPVAPAKPVAQPAVAAKTAPAVAPTAPAAKPAVQPVAATKPAAGQLEPAALKALARAFGGVDTGAAAPGGGYFNTQIDQLRQAGQRDEVVAILLDAMYPLAEQVGLFVIQQKQFACLDGRGPSHVIDMLKWVQFSTEEPSPFTEVVAAKEPHIGPLPKTAENQAALTALGASSGPLLLLPLMFKGRGIGVLYADELKGDLKPLVAELKLVADEAAAAFARIILQRKKSG